MGLYETLEVTPDATPEEIQKAHRRLVKRTHPDAGGKPEDFSKVQRAYAVLSDQRRRSKYDETGHADEAPEGLEAATAKMMLASKFGALVADENQDPRYLNVVAVVRAQLQSEVAQGKQHIVMHEKAIARGLQFRKRLKVKAGEPNIMGTVLDQQDENARKNIEAIQTAIRSLEIAIALAEHYTYEVDAEPQDPYARPTGMRSMFFNPGV